MNDKIAIYLRLSLADGDLKKGSKDESNSIENQRMLLHDYIGKQEDLFGEIVEYVDDGYTGTNFNRPAFQKMIVDLKQGDIKVIMVKDLSRLGRDYIGVGDYIEQIFPLMGVRFIAVNNSFDSMKLNNGTPGIEVAVSNLVNNMYSRDIAKKIRAALETNWKNGKATCTNVPFGYVWNKKGGQRWEIDPEAAPCVKKVFELALSGRNTTQIAYGMNELNLPTPGLYAKRKNLLMGSNPIIAPDSEMLWNAAIVWRILRRYEYTGALVMGRRKKIDVNTTSVRTLPEDKWIIAENAHEAIVTKDEYYQAQKAIRVKVARAPANQDNIFETQCINQTCYIAAVSQVVVAIHGFGRIALAARIDSNDTILRGEILQLVLENLTREGQAGNEDQRFTFAFFQDM